MNPDAYILFYVRQDVENADFRAVFSPISESEDEEGAANEGSEESGDKKKCCIL